MLEHCLIPGLISYPQLDPRLGGEQDILQKQAERLFQRARRSGMVERVKSALLRSERSLLDLASIPSQVLGARRYGGLQATNLECICGSLGRCADFDRHFRPLWERARERWVSVALARFRSIPLAPVTLIQVGECYFVQDGHHRISVARALGETAIDAEVVVWEIAGPVP